MNYLAHGWRFTSEPYFLAGTSAPDWLSVIDRKMRLRSRRAAEFLEHDDPIYRQFAAGVMRHIADDDWFHQTAAFAELSWQFTVEVRNRLPPDDGFRPSFVGHILVELLLDAVLIEEEPRRLDDYYAAIQQLDPVATQAVINTLATRTSDRVALLIPRFLSERFLYDYLDDGKLLTRLNHVMRRVGLPLLPEDLLEFLPAARGAVRKNRNGLLGGGEVRGKSKEGCGFPFSLTSLLFPLRSRRAEFASTQRHHSPKENTTMKYGMNLLLWTGELNDGIIPTLKMLKSLGYDGVEVPIFNPNLDYKKWGSILDDIGLERTAVTIRGVDDNPISSDAKVRKAGIEATMKTLDACAAVGATALVGPYHSAIGHFSGAGPTADEWKWGVESMRAVAEHAGKVRVTLGVECLNRFETYLLNTHADSARFCREVGHPRCRMMYDTFHSNIEEKCISQAINGCADMLCHVHISENDRSTPGKGNIRWEETFDALSEINYNGWLTVEAFGGALPEIAAATKIWRNMFISEQQLAIDSLAFMKMHVARRWG